MYITKKKEGETNDKLMFSAVQRERGRNTHDLNVTTSGKQPAPVVILRKTYIAGIVNLRTETLIRWKILLSYNFRINVNRHDVWLLLVCCSFCCCYREGFVRRKDTCIRGGRISWIVAVVHGTDVLFPFSSILFFAFWLWILYITLQDAALINTKISNFDYNIVVITMVKM